MKLIYLVTLILILTPAYPKRHKKHHHTSLYRRLKLSMIHLKSKPKTKVQQDRKLIPTLVQKAIQDCGIKAYPEFKYKNVQGGDMNIILPKSRPFMVYNTYPIIQHKVDSNSSYLSPPVLNHVPSLNI